MSKNRENDLLMRTGATGLLDPGDAIDPLHCPDVAKQKSVKQTRGASAPPIPHRYTPEMDQIILNWYRYLDKSKSYSMLRKGFKAKYIALYLNKHFGTNLTRNAIIGRYNRKLKFHGRPPATSTPVPQKTTSTPSLPKLKFLGDEP